MKESVYFPQTENRKDFILIFHVEIHKALEHFCFNPSSGIKKFYLRPDCFFYISKYRKKSGFVYFQVWYRTKPT